MSTSAAEQARTPLNRHLLGLLLMLAGLGLFVGGLFLPWLTITCTANCTPGAAAPESIGPLSDGPNTFFTLCPCAFLLWALIGAVILSLIGLEFLPVERRRAFPALLLAGLLLVGNVLLFLSVDFFASLRGSFDHLYHEVYTVDLVIGCAVSPLGVLLFAFGGWLRYHRSWLVRSRLPPLSDPPTVANPPEFPGISPTP